MIETWVVVLGLAIGAIFLLITLYGPYLIVQRTSLPPERFDAVNKTAQTLAQALGAAALVVAFSWTFTKDRQGINHANQQLAIEQYLASARVLHSNQAPVANAAAIFSIESVSRIRPEYNLPAREVVLGFVRQESAKYSAANNKNAEINKAWKCAAPPDIEAVLNNPLRPIRIDLDVQAAIDVLGRQNSTLGLDGRVLDFTGTYLVGANFSANPGSLSGFKGAVFWRAVLPGANFSRLDLSGARFEGAQMADWQGVGRCWDDDLPNHSGWDESSKWDYVVNFTDAKLIGADLSSTMLGGAIFKGADLRGTHFIGANLSRADFRGVLHLAEAKFSEQKNGEPLTACFDVPPRFDEGVEPPKLDHPCPRP